MSVMEKLKKKYPGVNFNHNPNPECKFCKGSGERKIKRTGKLTFCICTFVDRSFSNEAGKALGEFARRELDKIKSME